MGQLVKGKGKACMTSLNAANDPHTEHDTEDDGDSMRDPDDSSVGGRSYTLLHIPSENLYILDWEQLRRLAYRCNFWYTETMDDEKILPRSHDAHSKMVSAELQKLFERVHEHESQRVEFVRLVGDHIMDKIEGPQGLGTTTKEQFEKTVLAVLNEMRVTIKVDDFEFLYRLKALEQAQKDWERKQQRRRNTVLKRRPSSLAMNATGSWLRSDASTEDSTTAGAQSRRVSRQPSCDEQVQ
ncbi:hypothetical protein C1H76_6015 [Elsinoe australis]|uniref:Uncharacterized protein n=1 Tax=Elsinoe australis TaxID=40998 RepID=A0A4U7ATY3_9PEZI|nr:hypothetical protein C1H76_6015 [Elsinoe australis]